MKQSAFISMRTLIVLLICAFNCIFAVAQTKYEVTSETNLNVRKYASSNAPILGAINTGSQIDVYEISDGWAKIEYDNDYAYVSSNYIKKIEDLTAKKKKNSIDASTVMIFGIISAKAMLILILCLSIVLFILRVRNDDTPPTGSSHITNVALYIIVNALELSYMYEISSTLRDIKVIWFCMPDEVGWLWTIINFILFLGVICNQMFCLIGIMNDIEYRTAGNTKKRWGLYTLTIGVIALMISLVFYKESLGYIFAILGICQLIQIVLIFTGIVPQGGWGDAIVCCFVYVLGVATFLWMFVFFFVLLLAVIAGLIAITLVQLASSSSEDSDSDSASSDESN